MKNVKLRAAREKSGKTQAQVAREARVGLRLYQYYEAGKIDPSVRTAIRIARALGIKTLAAFYALWEEAT